MPLLLPSQLKKKTEFFAHFPLKPQKMNLIIEEAICSQTLQTIYKFGKRQKVVQGLTNILTIELCGYLAY